MSEGAKTITFVVVAVLLVGAAYVTRPEQETVRPPEMVGKTLFEKFDDPSKASRLEIVRYDEDLGQIHQFQVARSRQTGAWQIPSHDDYPADAEEQMRDAALSLVGLEVLGVVTEDPSEHGLFGVVEPNREDTKLGDKGVGLLVTFSDEQGKELAELIIGKEVKGGNNQRFVRIPGQDVVYDVQIDPSKLSTKFEDWIEEDLLQLNALDITRLTLKDYSVVETTAGPRLELRTTAQVKWDSSGNKWQLEQLVSYRGQEEVPVQLGPTEELNTQRLNDAKTALDNLKIVDVRRKPKGLGADLQADASFMDKPENRRDLLALGFYASRTPDGNYELLSANGEIHVLAQQGYEYVLRFGGVAGTSEVDAGLNRYLFVTARLAEEQFPQPTLEEPPAEDAPAEEGEDPDERQRRLAAEKERITKENERKMEEWREKKQAAEEKVRQLNTRFADWYYVIPEEEYRKIHLTRRDLVQESATAAEEGFGVDAFRQLEREGVPSSSEATPEAPAETPQP